jgi:hypothetical protein
MELLAPDKATVVGHLFSGKSGKYQRTSSTTRVWVRIVAGIKGRSAYDEWL